MNRDIESRLQQQLSIKALEMPEKPDRLDAVLVKGRRRLVLSRAAMSFAGVAAVLGVAGMAAALGSGPTESTFAVGQPDAAQAVKQPETIMVEDDGSSDSAEAETEPEVGGDEDIAIDQPVTADSSASFGGECLPAPALSDVSVTDPGKTVVRVASEAELQDAVQNLSANTVLLLAPGTYELSRTLYVRVDDVTIRGDSNRCDEVVLAGMGMENVAAKDTVPDGVWTDRKNLKVQNLTIRDVYFHAITLNGGAQSPEIYNVRLLDSGEQFIKVNPIGFADGVDDGVVNYAVIKYTSGAPTTDHGGGTGYTQGVDLHAGQNWTIKNSRFENLHTGDDADHLWGAAVLAWNGAANTTVEANVFVDVNRAISFGLDGSRPQDHSGGMIRNNMIVMTPGLYSDWRIARSDGSIIVWNSPGTQVLHNTITTNGNTVKSIELRFDSNGAAIRNNLVDAPITDRSSNTYVDADNVLLGPDNVLVSAGDAVATTDNADGSIFRNPTIGDLHLAGRVAGIVNVAPSLANATRDFDGYIRDRGTAADVGAHELVDASEPIPIGPEPFPTSTTTPASTSTSVPTSTSTSIQPTTTEPQPVTTSRPSPGKPGLVREADFQYEGSFRVPDGGGNERTTLAWGGAGLAYNEANNSLFLTGHSWHQLTAEIAIPRLGQSDRVSALPQASFIQPLQDVTDGQLPNIAQPKEHDYGRIGGYLVDGDDLFVSGYHYYDAGGTQVRSHLLTNTQMGASSDMVSLSEDVPARWLGGAMAAIPRAWQNDFGGDRYIGGLAGISIISNSSVGPSAATFSRASLLGNDPAELVLGYPLSAPLDVPDRQGDIWNMTSESRGMVFPDGTSSVLYFGTHGTGPYCYGTGSACGDPERSAQGTHAYPYRYQVWAYDAEDLVRVFRGGAKPESVRPYDVWEFELPHSAPQTQLGGAAYDPASGRIFISQGFADGDQPVIHVYTLR
ncbi:MAG: hypothetical protein ACRBK7_30745 [Acidimicrobiales bacterium]